MGGKVKWTSIVLTCPEEKWSQTLQKELELRQAKGYIDKDVFLLTVEDPKQDVGSGGATINALLTVAEYISAQRGYNVLSTEILKDSYILILHNGRGYTYDSCGRPFTCVPAQFHTSDHDGLICMVDLLMKLITEKIAVCAGPGVWVSSVDMILSIPYGAVIPWETCDVCAITVPAYPQYCRQHGVYKIDSKGFVEDILYKETLEKLEACERQDGTVPMVCGLVYFSAAVSEVLLSFFTKPPLDACTYFGVDSGEPTIRLSLFFDVMLPMCSGVKRQDFRSGARCGPYGKHVAVGDIKTMRAARTILWDDLNKFRIKACMIEEGTCLFPYTVQEHKRNILDRMMESCFRQTDLRWSNIVHSHIKSLDRVDETSIVMNSILEESVSVGPRSVVTHSHIQGQITIGKDSFISGLVTGPEFPDKVEFAESIIVQCYNINLPFLGKSMYLMTTHGRFDNIEMPMWKGTSSFCNDPWIYMMNRTGIVKEDLWGKDCEADEQIIQTALMFPVLHATEPLGLTELLWLQGVIQDTENRDILRRWKSSWRLSFHDIHKLIDLQKEFETRRCLFYSVGERDIRQAILQQENIGFRALYNSSVVEGFTQQMLTALDDVCNESLSKQQTSQAAGTAARTLANIADVLGCMAGPKGGLRSGPAANKDWARAFKFLEDRNIREGVQLMAKERGKWLDRPDKLIRAARHYEGAAQILIRHAVMSAKEFFKLSSLDRDSVPRFGHWVMVECPARIDIAGGWSDTPPITYEHGGAVVTAALLVQGKRPIGAKSRRIPDPKLVLVIHGGGEQKEVVCQELSDLMDYFQPHSPGALLKAAFLCAEIVDLDSSTTLRDQLLTNYGGGFELHSWTHLPHGSGLGTSSILAGAVMASLLQTAGKSCDPQGLIHLVLYLEQLLTTGGGWQDQVGGLLGGVQLGVSGAGLPLYVEAQDLQVDPEVLQALNERLVLIYTGKTRLARNLLQDVVRNWYARNPQIVETEDSLVQLANQCAEFIKKGDLESVGQCMDEYWVLKKTMAPGCEPEFVARLMTSMRPYALGMCMAGAGGGGFMYVLASDHEAQKNIKNMFNSAEVSQGVCVYEASIDVTGMSVTVIEVDEPSETISEEAEDMQEYYNQPETLPDEVYHNASLDVEALASNVQGAFPLTQGDSSREPMQRDSSRQPTQRDSSREPTQRDSSREPTQRESSRESTAAGEQMRNSAF
ncbi:L-fucose kinase-like isoform X2 [Dreissena polymorpha]|uniref:L-fucose kinase-like isoform X2 n=1 Tax=Dreissena polymorpha TaxID=45954 RepID=UPI002263BBF4|nr:L-fucose kinase-like isoform X2 [Dreissena polymorpha]